MHLVAQLVGFSAPKTQTYTHILSGLGGMGKTLLASAYAYQCLQEYQTIIWLDGRTPELFSSSIPGLAARLGISLPLISISFTILRPSDNGFNSTTAGW
jgi:hypothetical protein